MPQLPGWEQLWLLLEGQLAVFLLRVLLLAAPESAGAKEAKHWLRQPYYSNAHQRI